MHRRVFRAVLGVALALGSVAPAAAAGTQVYTMVPAFSPFSAAGRSATIKGIGFTASTTVDFGGTPAASVLFINSRTLVAVIPTLPSAQITTVNVSDPSNGSDEFFPFLHTGPVLYVSTTGSDSNNGTSPATPLQTLRAAFATVDAATPTEIRVEEGLYMESQLELLNATAVSCGWATGFGLRDPEGSVTEINGGRTGFVIRTSGLQNKNVIDGCTIANGLRDGFGGGGLALSADTAVINNSVISGNISSTIGGGIYWRASTSYGGTPTFSNSVIVGNRAANKSGGGIGVYQNYNTVEPVELKITANHIVGNRALNGRGGGISFNTGTYVGYNNPIFLVTDNVIQHNKARGGGGIGVTTHNYVDLVDFTTRNNLIASNTSQGGGGGILFTGVGTHTGEILSNTVADNTGAAFQGGGFVISGSVNLASGFKASDMILWNNAGGDYLGIGSSLVEYSLSGTVLPGTGNMSTDPLFVTGQFGDYYLRQVDPNLPPSPALDAGSTTAADLSLEPLTTATDNTTDAGANDLGYHSLLAIPPSANPISVSRVDPSYGDINGNDWILVRGDGFDPGAEVFFGGVKATDQMFLGNTRILARPAPHPVGFVNVRVFNPDSSNDTFVSGYLHVDNTAPVWPTTVGVVSATGGLDACERSVLLNWNAAVDMDSPPVVYEIYREECTASIIPGVPCDNFAYIPEPGNLIATTTNTFFIDNTMSSSGQAKDWVYSVRARDSAAFFINREYNFGKRLANGFQGSVAVPPEEIGNTLTWVAGTDDTFTWENSTGALRYGFYRTTVASDYSSLPTLPLLITLDTANNDADADGVTDTVYTDLDEPPLAEAFYYKVSALDNCGEETTSEILSP